MHDPETPYVLPWVVYQVMVGNWLARPGQTHEHVHPSDPAATRMTIYSIDANGCVHGGGRFPVCCAVRAIHHSSRSIDGSRDMLAKLTEYKSSRLHMPRSTGWKASRKAGRQAAGGSSPSRELAWTHASTDRSLCFTYSLPGTLVRRVCNFECHNLNYFLLKKIQQSLIYTYRHTIFLQLQLKTGSTLSNSP